MIEVLKSVYKLLMIHLVCSGIYNNNNNNDDDDDDDDDDDYRLQQKI